MSSLQMIAHPSVALGGIAPSDPAVPQSSAAAPPVAGASPATPGTARRPASTNSAACAAIRRPASAQPLDLERELQRTFPSRRPCRSNLDRSYPESSEPLLVS